MGFDTIKINLAQSQTPQLPLKKKIKQHFENVKKGHLPHY